MASNLSDEDLVTGRGVVWSNVDSPKTSAQIAAVADIEVNKKTGKITVKHVYQALSAGLSIYPGGVDNQIVGGVTQIISRLLHEQYRYSKTNVTSNDFVTYPILRFKDTPKVTAMVLQRNTMRRRAGRYGRRCGRRQRVLRRDGRPDANCAVHSSPRPAALASGGAGTAGVA
jgi:CO/xanthine dehydrogenase Mo-binding subunit